MLNQTDLLVECGIALETLTLATVSVSGAEASQPIELREAMRRAYHALGLIAQSEKRRKF